MDIGKLIDELRDAGATGLDEYGKLLRGGVEKVVDVFCEGLAALMFQRNGWQVRLTGKESPDLEIRLDGEVVHVEVKRFRQKEQDKLNEQAMSNTQDNMLTLLREPTETREPPAWEQIASVARNKAYQYRAGAANVLVIESDSECLDLRLCEAVEDFDRSTSGSQQDSELRRLNGIMLVDRNRTTFGSGGPHNVEFRQTQNPAVPLSEKLANALSSIRLERF